MTKKIAIIGSGISGLTCAYLLHKENDITVFEANDYIGGHTATKDVNVNGQAFAIDTGFIVFVNFGNLLQTWPNNFLIGFMTGNTIPFAFKKFLP